jgi:pilus assembly protein Flp/PilA
MIRCYVLLMQQLWSNRKGQDLVEYALLAGFVAVAAMSVFPAGINPAIKSIFSSIGANLANAGSQG